MSLFQRKRFSLHRTQSDKSYLNACSNPYISQSLPKLKLDSKEKPTQNEFLYQILIEMFLFSFSIISALTKSKSFNGSKY